MPERWQNACYPPPFRPETVGDWRLESPWVLAYDSEANSYYIAKFVTYPDDDPYSCWIQAGPEGYDCEPTHWMYLPTPPTED